MRRGARTTVVVLLAVLGATAAFAFDPAELNRITFTNSTGERIVAIVFSPSDSASWGPDLFGAESVLRDGASAGYYVHYPPSSFKFDILATVESGTALEIHNYRMTDETEGKVTFSRKDIVGTAPELTWATVIVQNDTGHDLQYMFLSPADSRAWGAELLDDLTLSPGDAHSVIVPVGRQPVAYTLLCADDQNGQYTTDVTVDPSVATRLAVSIGSADLQSRVEK